MDRILSDIANGWVTVRIENFVGRGSYLRDPVYDIAHALANAKRTGGGVARFDEEGSVFDVVFSDREIYVVVEREKTEVYHTDMELEAFAEEFVREIREDASLWEDWEGLTDEDDTEAMRARRREEVEGLLSMVEEAFGGEKDVKQAEER